MIFTVDGVTFDVRLDVVRTARVRSSDISGWMMDATWFNDVFGSYYDYEITLKYPMKDQERYTSLYELLTRPVAGHDFVFPYNGTTLQVNARLEEIPDEYIEKDNRQRYWKALAFEAKANAPTKEVVLGEVIAHNMPVTPEGMPASEGDVYEYESGAWVPLELVNGDEIGW